MPCCRRVARPARERQRARPSILWFLFALADRRSHRPTGEERQELLRNEVHEFPEVLLVLRKGPDRVRNRRGGLRERRRHARRPRSLRLRSVRPVASCRNRKCRRTRGRPPASRRYPAAGEGRNASSGSGLWIASSQTCVPGTGTSSIASFATSSGHCAAYATIAVCATE